MHNLHTMLHRKMTPIKTNVPVDFQSNPLYLFEKK